VSCAVVCRHPPVGAPDGAPYGAPFNTKIDSRSGTRPVTCGDRSGAEGTRTPDPLHAICHQRRSARPLMFEDRCYS
jgi:hypothetical protein